MPFPRALGAGLLLVVVTCSVTTGCVAFEPRHRTRSGGPDPDRASDADKQRYAAQLSQEVATCQRSTSDADRALARALDLAESGGRDANGQPVPSLTETARTLKKLGVAVAIQNQGSPQAPMLAVVAAPSAEARPDRNRALAGQTAVAALRAHVEAVNGAMGASYGSTLACLQTAKLATLSLGGFSNGEDVTDEMFAPYVRLLDANAKSEAAAASAVVTVSILQASLAGHDPEAIGRFVVALKDARTKPAVVTPVQARAAFELAGKRYRDECEASWQATLAAQPDLKARMPGPSPCSKEGSRMTSSQRQRYAAAESGGGRGSGGGLEADLVEHLVPSDGPVAAAVEGAAAIGKGDYLGAAKSALKLVPKGTPVGAVIHGVLAILG